MKDYQHQVSCHRDELDMDFWRKPEGVNIEDDELSFLLIPDEVEALATFELSKQVHRYQREHINSRERITKALIVTMGGMLPGVLLYDHLVDGRDRALKKWNLALLESHSTRDRESAMKTPWCNTAYPYPLAVKQY